MLPYSIILHVFSSNLSNNPVLGRAKQQKTIPTHTLSMLSIKNITKLEIIGSFDAFPDTHPCNTIRFPSNTSHEMSNKINHLTVYLLGM